MPQFDMNLRDGRSWTCLSPCEAKDLVNGHIQRTGKVKDTLYHNGYPAAATKNREWRSAAPPNGTKPQYKVNGHIDNWPRGETGAPKRAHQRTSGKGGGTDSPCSSGTAFVNKSNGATDGMAATLPVNCNQTEPEPSLSASAKKQPRRRRKSRNKRVEWAPPQEDWENELQMNQDYDPDDLLPLAARPLSSARRDTLDPPLMNAYSPARHHPPVTKVTYDYTPTEPGQFTDTDE